DPVAAVEPVDVGEGLLAELVAGGQDLDAAGGVREGREDQAAVATQELQPAGDADAGAGGLVAAEPAVAGAQLGDGVVAAEVDGVRLDAALAQVFELLEAMLALAGGGALVGDGAHGDSWEGPGAPAIRSERRRPSCWRGRLAA